MVWFDTFNDLFFMTLGGAFLTFMGVSCRLCYKSKCKNVKMCCLEIQRDTLVEETIDLENQRSHENRHDVIPKYSDAGNSRSYNGGDSSKNPR